MQALYVATATATGGRHGRAVTSDGNLAVDVVPPRELGGPDEPGTNPEQLFACGYSACYLSALTLVAAKRDIDASRATVTADVGLLQEGRGFKLQVELKVKMPGVEPEQALKLAEIAHQVCPYSNATRGNIDVALHVEGATAAA